MGHDKLRRFAENETFECLLQPRSEEIISDGIFNLHDHPVKGHWAQRMFHRDDAEIVLELGCGKGEYTIDLARRYPQKCFIGVDIKGARLWKGAKTATQEAMDNVAFLRTRIEFITAFFAPQEVSQIWLTFSDPQMKSENSRLTSPLFLDRYRKFLAVDGIVHLKTDSQFLHEYTLSVIRANNLELLCSTSDLYADKDNLVGIDPVVYEVQTFYEKMFLEKNLPITYLAFKLEHDGPFVYPTDFDEKAWRDRELHREQLESLVESE